MRSPAYSAQRIEHLGTRGRSSLNRFVRATATTTATPDQGRCEPRPACQAWMVSVRVFEYMPAKPNSSCGHIRHCEHWRPTWCRPPRTCRAWRRAARYVTGGLITAVIGIAMMPWKLYAGAAALHLHVADRVLIVPESRCDEQDPRTASRRAACRTRDPP